MRQAAAARRDLGHEVARVTRHVTTWKHGPFSRAPRVCLRLGLVQNQRFSGPHGCQLAPSWASSQKNPEKTVKNVLKNGAKWRFFGGPERHFAVPARTALDRNPLLCQILIESDLVLPRCSWIQRNWLRPAHFADFAHPAQLIGVLLHAVWTVERYIHSCIAGCHARDILGTYSA